MGLKTKIFLLLSIFCIISTCSASDTWTQESLTTLKICNLSCGPDTIRINDYNDNAIFISLIRDDQVVESDILESSVLMDDGLIKVVHTTSYSGKRSVVVYSKNVPRFTVSTDTEENNEKYNSDITINCVNPPAYNVKCSVESENVKFYRGLNDFRYYKFDTELEKRIRYKLYNVPSINLTIEYEDDLGNDYIQKFDLLNNLPVKVEMVKKEKSKGYTIIKHSVEDREKEIFYRAIERALNHIQFTPEAEAELRSIQKQLE